ncbi:MAG: tetratricopeptide repeat protein [Verrucomicrobiia bacterium]|jgi:tetratricopeptide (TPR) repeat protein
MPTLIAAINTRLRDKLWLQALGLVLVTFLAYQPVWHAGFIWDDDDHLTANPAMTAPDGLRMIWSSLAVSRYYPLTLTTFWVQRQLWGLNPLPYHLVNVALHSINAVLIFLLLRRLRVRAAWLAAMLWAVHPVNVESVAWITELKNTQSGVFFFLALLCFLRFETEGGRHWYSRALLCGLAALLSKPSTVVLPLALLLCVWWLRGRWSRTDLLRVVPFFVMALGMSAVAIIEQRGWIVKAGTTEWTLGMAERFVIAGKVVWFYAAKLLWPVPLAFIYPRWDVTSRSWLSWAPLAGLVAIGLLLWGWRRKSWARAALFGCGYFVAALLPVLGFLDVFYFRYAFVADHFQYLAGVGVIALVVGAAATGLERVGRWGRDVGLFAAAASLLLLGASTWKQAHIYQDRGTLWRDTVAKNPNAWMAQYNLANWRSQEGRIPEAIALYEEALRLKPDFADAQYNLALTFWETGRTQEAIDHYELALRIRPGSAATHYNLAVALEKAGRIQEAITHYEQAVRLKPNLAVLHYGLGVALENVGRTPEAIAQYEQTLRISPGFIEARGALARLQAGQ